MCFINGRLCSRRMQSANPKLTSSHQGHLLRAAGTYSQINLSTMTLSLGRDRGQCSSVRGMKQLQPSQRVLGERGVLPGEVKHPGRDTRALREVSFPACPGPQLSCLSISEWCPLSWCQCPLPLQQVLGVRAGGHPGTVPKAAASCRSSSASSCPSVGGTAPEWC